MKVDEPLQRVNAQPREVSKPLGAIDARRGEVVGENPLADGLQAIAEIAPCVPVQQTVAE
jgi:hypothetical protein